MKRHLITLLTCLALAPCAMAQITTDDILDSLINDVQQGKPVENVETDVALQPVHHRILLIGDDLVEGLAPRLYNYAMGNGHAMHTTAWMGSTTKTWGYTTELPKLIKKEKPTFIIVCLGTNDLSHSDVSLRAPAVKEIMKEIGDIPFVWIGPISVKTIDHDPGIVDMIRQTVGDNRFYDSFNLHLAREDEMRPTMEAATRWADNIALWMSSPQTAHPILMDMPQATIPLKSYEVHKSSYQGKMK
jgi:hypothetical protein